MSQQIYGYVRVSTREQNEDRQVIAMREFGIKEEYIRVEKMSGKDFKRPIYKQLLEEMALGDVLVIKSLDRLGRDYNEVIDQWRYITRERGIAIVVIDIPLLDTRKKNHDLTSSFVADLVLQILSYVAEQERLFNRQRQAEGIAAAKARGVKFGNKPLERPVLFDELCAQWKCGQITSRAAGKQLGISHTTFLSWVRGTIS